VRKESLIIKIILWSIIIIPIIICIIYAVRYKELDYDIGEFTRLYIRNKA